MKVDKIKLSQLLGVSIEGLKTIERRKTLKKRLSDKGYILISKSNINHKTTYDINPNKNTSINTTYAINAIYNVHKIDNFIEYFNIRTEDAPNAIQSIADKVNVNRKTVSKWDNTLQDKKILSKDGYYYFRLDKEENEMYQVSIEEYKSFWKNKAYINAFKKLQEKYINGYISLTELQLASGEIAVIISTIENKYYYKVKKYKVDKSNKLYIDTKEIIERGH